jgi:hypothetical protein
MKKNITVFFPKLHQTKYFSAAAHQYSSSINVLFNKNKIFSNISDQEENLPMIYQHQIELTVDSVNTIEVCYNIYSNWSLKEDASIQYQIYPTSSGTCKVIARLLRNNFVISPDLISSEYMITSKINDYQINIDGKSWFTGNTNQQEFDTEVNIADPLILETISKKVLLMYNNQVYYDHIQLALI